jgi:DASS family divalent anion:Na+ symporter
MSRVVPLSVAIIAPSHSYTLLPSLSTPDNASTDLQPAKFGLAAISVAVGLVIRFVIPCPAELTLQAWSVLAIFVSTIFGACDVFVHPPAPLDQPFS